MQDVRKDLHSSGKCPALAGYLPGVQGEVSAGGDHHKKVPKMREDLHIPVRRPAMAEILPGVSENEEVGSVQTLNRKNLDYSESRRITWIKK